MTRLPLIADAALDPDSKALFDDIANRGGTVPDLYRLLANAPEMLRGWTGLAWPLRNADYADRALRELLIMRTAQLSHADYEWAHHWHFAVVAGVTEPQLRALRDWQGSPLFSERERAALTVTDALVMSGKVPDAAFVALRRLFDAAAIIQLILTVTFYVSVARFAHAMEIELETDHERLAPPLD